MGPRNFLGLLYCFALILVECLADWKCQSPIGVRMCRLSCLTLNGCTVFYLSTRWLRCCVTLSNGTEGQPEGVLFKLETEDLFLTDASCQLLDRIIPSKRSGTICVPGGQRLDRSNDVSREQYVGKRLLMAKKLNSDEKRIFVHDLTSQNSSVKRYPFLEVKMIIALVYSPRQRRIYVAFCDESTFKIVYAVLDSDGYTLYATTDKIKALALDDERNWLLYTNSFGKEVHKIYRGNDSWLFVLKQQQETLTIAARGKVIYIGIMYCVNLYSYNGVMKRKIPLSTHIPFALDRNGRYLYFYDVLATVPCVSQYDIHNKNSTCLIKTNNNVGFIGVDSKSIYVQEKFKNLKIYNSSSQKLLKTISLSAEYHICILDI